MGCFDFFNNNLSFFILSGFLSITVLVLSTCTVFSSLSLSYFSINCALVVILVSSVFWTKHIFIRLFSLIELLGHIGFLIFFLRLHLYSYHALWFTLLGF